MKAGICTGAVRRDEGRPRRGRARIGVQEAEGKRDGPLPDGTYSSRSVRRSYITRSLIEYVIRRGASAPRR